jgi:hypothetical protein
MADFNRHLKKSKVLVFFTIFAFLYMSCFTSCSKAKNQESTVNAQKSGGSETTENSEAPKVQTAGNQEVSGSSSSAPADSSNDLQAGSSSGATASAENVGQKRSLTQEELNQLANKMDRYFQALEEAVQTIPRDTFDPQAIVDKVGKNPEDLFKWVRDSTFFVPYQGVLRGPTGVLMDRMGNSLDRVLLLGELIKLAGYKIRIAHGHFSQEEAKNILDNVSRITISGNTMKDQQAADEVSNILEAYANKYQLDSGELFQTITEMSQVQEESAQRIRTNAEEQANFISGALGKAIKVFENEQGNDSIQAIRDHWWLKIERERQWIDLDPTLPDSIAGQTLVQEIEEMDLNELPDSLSHHLDIRVIIEQSVRGDLKEKTVLSHSLNDLSLLDKRVALHHIPLNWPDDFDISNGENLRKEVTEAILSEHEWLPVLDIGEEQIKQNSFSATGEVSQNVSKKRSGPAGLAGGLFSALSGKEDRATEENSFLTAEWIEYETNSPGSKAKKIRRQIFDLIGSKARADKNINLGEISRPNQMLRSLAVLGNVEILIQNCNISPEFAAYRVAKSLLTQRDMLSYLAHERDRASIDSVTRMAARTKPLPGLELNLACIRNFWSKHHGSFYLDKPNIYSYSRRLSLNEQGRFVEQGEIDIIANDVGFFAKPNKEAYQARIYQGVFDTNAEALVLEKLGGKVENTSDIFSKSRKQGIEWIVIRDSNDPILGQVQISEDIRERVTTDLSQGYIVILPKQPVLNDEQEIFGWWRINPTTGNVVGIGQNGSGQAMTEIVGIIGAVGICFVTASGAPESCKVAAYGYCIFAAASGAGFFLLSYLKMGAELAVFLAIMVVAMTANTAIVREICPE